MWQHVYHKDNLGVSSDEHPVLLTEAALNPQLQRQKAAEVFFEGFNVPAMYVAPQVSDSFRGA